MTQASPEQVDDSLVEIAQRVRRWILEEPMSKPPFYEIRQLAQHFLQTDAFEELDQ